MSDTLPISSVVNVTISTTPVAPSQAGFGTLLFITSDATGPLSTGTRTKVYSDISSVNQDWGGSTEVDVAAATYFSQNPKPTSFMVGFWDKANTETIGDALTAITASDDTYYFMSVEKTTRDDADAEAIAAFASAGVKVFGTASNNADVLDSQVDTDIASVFNAQSYRRCFVVYSSSVNQYPEISVMGRAATVNFSADNSTITLKFKQLPGITVEKLSTAQKAALDGKKANAYISVGGVNMYAEGFMSSGDFLDEVHGIDWLQSQIESNVFTRLYGAVTKVPYTDKGAAQLEQQVRDALAQGVRNGLLAPGEDSEGNFLADGYTTSVVPVADVPPADKSSRKGPTISFKGILAGAIHSVEINGVVER